MAYFNPDKAIFGVFAAELGDDPKETAVSYTNDAARNLFGDLSGKRVVDILNEVLGDSNTARNYFDRLLEEGSILFEGKLNGRDVQYHSSFDSKKNHLQAAIIDTTESKRNREGFEYTAEALARAAEVMDEETGNHLVRINYYSRKLAELLDLGNQFVDNIKILAQLHDVGKLFIDRGVLRKPGKLTEVETEEFKKHTHYGAKIIGNHPRLAMAREIALGHHERWDGGGYPNGLSEEEIPLPARIVIVVDIFDALVSKRAYKEAFSYQRAKETMTDGDEKLKARGCFDPKIFHKFLENYDCFTDIHKQSQ